MSARLNQGAVVALVSFNAPTNIVVNVQQISLIPVVSFTPPSINLNLQQFALIIIARLYEVDYVARNFPIMKLTHGCGCWPIFSERN